MDTEIIWTLNDFSKLFHRIRNGNLLTDVDVSKYKFFGPKEILMLTEFFVVQNSKQINASLVVGEKNGWYFNAIDLIGFCNTNYENPVHQKQSSSTAIPIKRIDITTMNAYIDDALNFFSTYCIGKDTTILSIGISEIINNVNDHAKSAYDAYIFSQYYPKIRQIKFAMSDLGVGIPETVNTYFSSKNESRLKNGDALRWAVQYGKTSQSQFYNKGYGLANVISNLKGVGTLEIYSNDVACRLRNNYLSYFQNPIPNFIGTLIEINIDIDNLEQADETILEEFTF